MEEQLLNGAADALVQITRVGNRSSWKESIFVAWRQRTVDLNQAGIALAWVEAAKCGKLIARMDPASGLNVSIQN